MDSLQVTQFLNKYARFDWSKHRRESWSETVERSVAYLEKVGGKPVVAIRTELYDAIYKQEVSPSMRLLASAGESADKNQISIYNCSFLPLQSPADFGDLTILLGHGVGVGFSVEQQYVAKWPVVPVLSGTTYSFVVPDSIEGWALSLRILLENRLVGIQTEFDYNRVRPAGAPLKTRGGHASGPGPLIEAHEAIERILFDGGQLTSIQLFDMACHVAHCIVSGGVRRSAMITLFDWDDAAMKAAKSGEWWRENLQRQNANISGVIDSWMDEGEWLDYVKLMDSNKSGEPGIWSRYAIRSPGGLPERRKFVQGLGSNPCAEQILRPYEFCNLSQALIRNEDDLNAICEKVRIAAIIGTIQSAMVNFHNINPLFAENSSEERLLGVSLSGIMDNPITAAGDPGTLQFLRQLVIDTNKEWAKKLKIKQSVSTTCVKPDGNTSVLYNTAPGIHGRYAPYYIRRMRIAANTPVANYVLAAGVPAEPALGETWEDVRTVVLSFPVKSPDGAIVQRERGAIEQLDNWLLYKKNFTETNPSVTITYRENELEDIAKWLFKNQHYAVGLSFLPADDHTYVQAPYEEITEAQYNEMAAAMPILTESAFWQFENGFVDTTEAAQNLACVGGACLM